MKTARNLLITSITLALTGCGSTTTKVVTEQSLPQTQYAASLVEKYIPSIGKGYKINIGLAADTTSAPRTP